MAFCPHCGKSVAEQAVKCIACGGELEPRGKAARFKGTMMMTPAAVPGSAVAPVPAPAPAPPSEAPKPIVHAAPTPASATDSAMRSAPSKVAKHTMIGTGGAGLPAFTGFKVAAVSAPAAPPPPAGMASVPPSVPSAAPAPTASAQHAAFADTAKGPAVVAPIQAPPPERAAAREDSQRMALGGSADPKGAVPRLDPKLDRADFDNSLPPNVVPGQASGKLIVIGIIGLTAIAAMGYIVARLMGLTN